MELPRRQFLTYLGWGSLSLLAKAQAWGAEYPLRRWIPPAPEFTPIPQLAALADVDQVRVPSGFGCQVLARWGDPLGSHGPYGPEEFGFNNDFVAYLPADLLRSGRASDAGLLWVNHEVPDGRFVSGHLGGLKTARQIEMEMLSVGGSVLAVTRQKDRWHWEPGHPLQRRFTGLYPEFRMTGPVADMIPVVRGTVGNCSGGITPWGTILTCEEQYDSLYDSYGWGDAGVEPYPLTHHGWVAEIDPFGELPPVMHSCLGRFAHENCALTFAADGRLVVYMGDDSRGGHLYKYISHEHFQEGASRAEKQRLLTDGTLYAADLRKGRWIPLNALAEPELLDLGTPVYASQADLLLRPMQAAKALGATPLDRPEDCEIHPLDGSLYLALTNNTSTGNFFGQILRLVEVRDDPGSEMFRWELFLAGGPQTGIACPDNLCFDRAGNLWVATDFGGGPYDAFGTNGLFCVPTSGTAAGFAYQFAAAPPDSEFCGPWFTPDESTLFLSVQHPGSRSEPELSIFTSHWPDGAPHLPRPAVVAITGF